MSENFYVDASPLSSPARKPKHLKSRLESRSAPDLFDELWKSSVRRNKLLEEKKAKLEQQDESRTSILRKLQEKKAKVQKESELRLKSAEEKRRGILQERQTNSATHLEHVKNVRESHSRKVQEEMKRKKEELDAKIRHVSKRRQKLLYVPRSRLLDASVSGYSDDEDREDATKKIQRYWRKYKLTPLIKAYLSVGLNVKSAKKMSFEELIAKTQSKPVMQATSALLARIERMSNTKFIQKSSVRTFLSSFIIVAHTNEIIPTKNHVSDALVASANQMLSAFEAWIKRSLTYDVFIYFRGTLNDFLVKFDEWKFEDVKAVAEGMISHWIHLEKLWMSVRNHPDKEAWKQGVIDQQKAVVEKINRLGPHAIKIFEEAKKKHYEEAQASEEIPEGQGEETPRKSVTSSLSTSPERFPSVQRQDSNKKDSVSIGSTPEKKSEASAQPAPSSSEISKLLAPFGSDLSPEQLAHELSLDPDFELKPRALSPFENQIKAIAKRAFFDSLKEEYESRKYDRVLGIFEDIKKGLLSMLPEKAAVANEIVETIDSELFLQQIEHGSFEIAPVISYIVSKMLQLCAPVRDAHIRSILEETDILKAFPMILDSLDDMKLDLMNYKLKSIRPILSQYSVDYEKNKFKEALEKNVVTLEKTKKWFATTVQSMQDAAAARNPENIDIPENRIRFEDMYHDAYLSLLFSSTPISRELVPEAFILDTERMFSYQNEIQAITIVAVLLMLLKNTVPEVRRNNDLLLKMKDDIFAILKDADTSIDHVVTFLNSSVEEYTKTYDEETKAKVGSQIETMVKKTLSVKDPVYSLINRRIMNYTKSVVITGDLKKSSLATSGLGEVSDEVQAIAKKIAILARHNKKVYSEWYDDILRNLVQ